MFYVNKNSLNHLVFGNVLACLLVAFSLLVGYNAGWVTPENVNIWEILATLTSYICTYLCVVQSRWNYPVGIISTALLSVVFWQSSLYGSMALNIYLIPTLVYGYFVWNRDDDTKPVQHVKPLDLLGYLFWTAIAGFGAYKVVEYFGGTLALLDTSLMVGSIFAQFLLDRKKIETWFVWALVNIVSIYVYFNAGLYLLTFQFVVFLANTIYGYCKWRQTLVQ